MIMFLSWVILLKLFNPSEESQIYDALGCHSDAVLYIVQVLPDGQLQWPDGSTCSIEEGALLLPGRLAGLHNPALAIKAPKDVLMATLLPLLEATKDSGFTSAILATDDQGEPRVIHRY